MKTLILLLLTFNVFANYSETEAVYKNKYKPSFSYYLFGDHISIKGIESVLTGAALCSYKLTGEIEEIADGRIVVKPMKYELVENEVNEDSCELAISSLNEYSLYDESDEFASYVYINMAELERVF